jgi:hypothetical protein
VIWLGLGLVGLGLLGFVGIVVGIVGIVRIVGIVGIVGVGGESLQKLGRSRSTMAWQVAQWQVAWQVAQWTMIIVTTKGGVPRRSSGCLKVELGGGSWLSIFVLV